LLKIIKYAAVRDEPVIIKCKPSIEISSECAATLAVDLRTDSQMAQAQKLYEEARLEAEKCLSEAAAQAEQLKQQAYEIGYQEGFTAGQQEGFQSGRQEAETAMQQQLIESEAKAGRLIACAEQQYKESLISAERQIIELSLNIASKVLARELEENPMVVLPIVKAALAKVCDQEQISIRVCPEDFELVIQAKRDLQIMVGRENALSIISDHTVSCGGCMIDTPYGTVDARIDTQLEAVKKALQEIMP